ncbi:MAG: tetratricopeptide repeat protein [Verrucomicrobiota bacterium]
MRKVLKTCLTALAIFGSTTYAFELVDTNPGSPEFKKRFYGSFGINSAIEPSLKQEDRPLYESIEPHLESNPRKAIELARKGIDADSNAAFDFLVGSLYYTLDDYRNAATYLQSALKKFPDFRRAHRNLALIYIQQDRYNETIKHLLRVIQLGGGDGQVYSMLAYAYLTLEKYHSALSAYQLARMFLPESKDVRRGEAQCLLMTSQYEAAIKLFDELINESPETQEFWVFQANSFVAINKLDDAIANLELAHRIARPEAKTLTLLGDLYLAQDAHELGLASYKAAIRQNPNVEPEQALKPLRRLMQLGVYDAAESYLNLMSNSLSQPLSPKQASEVAVFRAQLRIENGELDKGLAELEAILQEDPLNSSALLYIADVQLKQEAYEEAEFYFERAKSVPEAQVEALIGLGRTAVAQAKFKDALKYLNQSQRIKRRADVSQFIESIEKVVAAE